ncbi:IclR family transcriptional regulator [Halocella sp. SP3-1]|nr:IclR family transcriptional regulator [Halocella sp. SP3-1]
MFKKEVLIFLLRGLNLVMVSGIVKSLQKGIRIIDCLARNGEMGVTDLSKEFGVSKSSIYNLLNTFAQNHWVEKNEITNKYKLGIRLFELGNIVREGFQLREVAIPFMKELVDKIGETVHLTVLDDGMVVYIESAQPGNKFSAVSLNERRVYMHCTGVGKAIMAFLKEEEIDKIIEEKGLPLFTANTIIDSDELKKELGNIRKRGYAIDDIEHEPGVRCVGVPIFNEKGDAFASMSLTGPSPRFSDEKIKEYADIMKEITFIISKKLGWKGC